MLPALAASYGVAKCDYPALATHIAAASPPGSVGLAIGDHPDYVVICMTYYLRRLHAPVTVLDARLLNSDGIAWGVAVLPSARQQTLLSRPQDTVTDFEDVSGTFFWVRATRGGLSSTDQVGAVLRWESAQEPGLDAPLKLLGLLAGRARAGPNLFPESLQTGVSASYKAPVEPAVDFALTFGSRNSSLSGYQNVSARLVDAARRPIVTYLDIGGHRCRRTTDWPSAAFSIYVPPKAAAVIVQLQVQGSGTAEFRDPALSAMQS